MRADGVVDVPLAVHVEGVADDAAVAGFVFQGAEEPSDHAVLQTLDPRADVAAVGRRQ